MTDQVRRLVEEGQILNYDACFQNQTIAGLAKQHPVDNDDLNQSFSKDRLCRLYYNNAFWRGGINGNIDDRLKSPSHAGWNPQMANNSQQTIARFKSEYDNNVNRVRQAIVSMNVFGNNNDVANVSNTKNEIERIIGQVKGQNSMLDSMLILLKKENSDEMLQDVAVKEGRLRMMDLENDKYKHGNELRREQTKDLYNRYESNFNSSAFGYYFGYNPINPTSQSSLLFTSFFMGFIGLITLGIQVAPILLGSGSTVSGSGQSRATNSSQKKGSSF